MVLNKRCISVVSRLDTNLTLLWNSMYKDFLASGIQLWSTQPAPSPSLRKASNYLIDTSIWLFASVSDD